jgi:hypothetical protein
MAQTIDLARDGNAFTLLGLAKNFCKQMGEDSTELVAEMQQGDYDHLVATFKHKFKYVVNVIDSTKDDDDDDDYEDEWE